MHFHALFSFLFLSCFVNIVDVDRGITGRRDASRRRRRCLTISVKRPRQTRPVRDRHRELVVSSLGLICRKGFGQSEIETIGVMKAE